MKNTSHTTAEILVCISVVLCATLAFSSPSASASVVRHYHLEEFDLQVHRAKGGPSIVLERVGGWFPTKEKFQSGDSVRLVPSDASPQDDAHVADWFWHLSDKDMPFIVLEIAKPDNSYVYEVFQLTDRARKVGTVYSGYERIQTSTPCVACPQELQAHYLFSDWGQQSISQPVVLKLDDNRLVLDPDAMKATRPANEDLDELKDSIRLHFDSYDRQKDPVTWAPPELAATVLKLIFAGDGKRAESYLREVWPSDTADADKYWMFLLSELRKTPYWNSLRDLNSPFQLQ